MKKLILILILVFLNCGLINASEFRWSKIINSEDKTTAYYIDKKTIFRVGSYKYFWFLTDSIDDKDSVITLMMVNCSTFESRPITFTAFAKNMGKGEIKVDFIVPEDDISWFEWTKWDTTNTSHGVVLQKVCA